MLDTTDAIPIPPTAMSRNPLSLARSWLSEHSAPPLSSSPPSQLSQTETSSPQAETPFSHTDTLIAQSEPSAPTQNVDTPIADTPPSTHTHTQHSRMSSAADWYGKIYVSAVHPPLTSQSTIDKAKPQILTTFQRNTYIDYQSPP